MKKETFLFIMLHFLCVCSIACLFGGVSTLLTEDMRSPLLCLETITSPADSTSEQIRRWSSQSLTTRLIRDRMHVSPFPELSRFWMIVGPRCHKTQRTVKRSVRCVCVYPSRFFLFIYYYLKENLELQVAGCNLFWSPSVSMFLRFSSNWKRTCSKQSTISLKLPVECFFC